LNCAIPSTAQTHIYSQSGEYIEIVEDSGNVLLPYQNLNLDVPFAPVSPSPLKVNNFAVEDVLSVYGDYEAQAWVDEIFEPTPVQQIDAEDDARTILNTIDTQFKEASDYIQEMKAKRIITTDDLEPDESPLEAVAANNSEVEDFGEIQETKTESEVEEDITGGYECVDLSTDDEESMAGGYEEIPESYDEDPSGGFEEVSETYDEEDPSGGFEEVNEEDPSGGFEEVNEDKSMEEDPTGGFEEDEGCITEEEEEDLAGGFEEV